MVDKALTVQELEILLGHLAAQWRASFNSPDKQTQIAQEYQAIVYQLYELGWDDVIDIESELPEEYMPDEYMQRNPSFYSDTINFADASRNTNVDKPDENV